MTLGVLVDTHAVLWWASEPERLPAPAMDAIENRGLNVWVSAASLAEIAIKSANGKLRDVPEDLPAELIHRGFRLLGLEPEHAWKLRDLPRHHNDPFDRMLIAQALYERMPIVSADGHFARYEGLDIIWD